jgi:hypothetical protein
VATDFYACWALAAWPREPSPSILRIFRGTVAEADEDAFAEATAQAYLDIVGSNPSCAGVAVGRSDPTSVAIATLWTDWDAVLGATRGDPPRGRPFRMPGWRLEGTAVHYELVSVFQQ